MVAGVYHMHRRKDLFNLNPDVFDPDNFLPENVSARHPNSVITFSVGARSCIGIFFFLLI